MASKAPADSPDIPHIEGDRKAAAGEAIWLSGSADASPNADGRDVDEGLCFGDFVLLPRSRALVEGSRRVQIGSRAFDILCLLVERAGLFVSKRDILAHAWPTTHVEDANIRVQVAELRKVLGDGREGRRYIVNAPSRGYAFIAPVGRIVAPSQAGLKPPAKSPALRSMPAALGKVIGRAEASRTLLEEIGHRQLVTVVGSGGVGKTTLVASVMSRLNDGPDAGHWGKIYFVDLAPVSDERVVLRAFASALDVAIVNDEATSSLVQHIRGEACLIVVDNCEHVIDAVVDIIEAILRDAPAIHVLATSREPLRAECEWVHRLHPLEVPPATSGLSLQQAIAYPAIELFVERAGLRSGGYQLHEDDVEPVIEICRRLDGIPLALELAAGRLDAFGARGLAAILDDALSILTKGRRRAMPRQQTLRATLDWSFRLLKPRDQILLQRLAVFSNRFTLQSASSVVAGGGLAASDVVEGIADLVAQSLVTPDMNGDDTYFYLLETTRAYAREKLALAPEVNHVAKRHAVFCCELLAELVELFDEDDQAALARSFSILSDARRALQWAFSSTGDRELGVVLTVETVPLWLRLSLVNECQQWVEEALDLRDDQPRPRQSDVMKLQTARAWSLMYKASTAHQTGAAWVLARDLAERAGDNDYRLRSLWGLWAGQMKSAAFVDASEAAARFKQVSQQSADPDDCIIADRLIGTSLHFLGDQAGARSHIERMLANYNVPRHRRHIARYQVAPHVAALVTQARILWVQGYADEAMRAADASVDAARAIDHRLSLCFALAQASSPLALLEGDLDYAEEQTDLLFEETDRHRLDVWHIYATAYRGQLLLRRGEIQSGLPLIETAVEQLRSARFMQHYSAFVVALVEGLVLANRLDAADAAVDGAIAHATSASDRWIAPDIFRLKGEIAFHRHEVGQGESYFARSIELAHEQRAFAWQLRTAISLSRILDTSGRIGHARRLLTARLTQLTEGFEGDGYINLRRALKRITN
ncbi:winged helix-turn-helix domain-containing protein [Bosea sp. LjRoot9]|uniref:ATP-binding protein n=1 Tax=Bosea sp. LjRoot9 TaxID=3342341 RepID=UPI003ECCEA38